MRVKKYVAALIAPLALFAQVAVLGVGPTEASTESSLKAVTPLADGFGAIEVDETGQRVFVSSPESGAVTVLDADGAHQTSLAVPGADSLLVDGNLLYVASTTAGRIDVFDTASLALVTSYGSGNLVTPHSLAMAAGRLWTTTGNCGSGSLNLVSIDPRSGATKTHPPLTWLSYCPFLFSSPTDDTVLFGFDEGLSPTTLVRLDVAQGGAVTESSLRTGNSNAQDGAVLPDGQTIALASGAPYEIRTFLTEPLAPHGVVYPTGHYPNAVEATAANGGLLAAARDASYENDVDVFRLGDPSAPLFQHDFGSSSDTVMTGGLAFSPDGTRLFVVSGDWSGDSAKLNVFDLADPGSTDTVLEVSPTYAAQGQPVTFTATVTARGGGLPAGTVSFYEGASPRGTATLDGFGVATLVTGSLPVGPHTFTARYGGDTIHKPSSDQAGTVVRAAGAANPANVVPLPPGFSAIEVDPGTGRVFVSSAASSVVTVLDLSGAVVGSIGVPGAGALLVDGPTLYVVSTTGGRIDAFDTGSLARTGSYGGGTLVLDSDTLVKAGGKLWTAAGQCGATPQLVSVDLGTGAITAHSPANWFAYCPFLFTSPADPDLVLGFDKGLSPATVVRFDVTSGSPVLTGTLRTDNSNAIDGEVLPDGQTFALASGAPYEIRTFLVDPLQQFGVVYPTGNYPNAVEATPAAGGLLAAGRDAVYDNDVDVFRLGDPSLSLFEHDFGTTADTVLDRGLAFAPDGRTLFVVSGNWYDHSARLNVFDLTNPNTVTTLTAAPAAAHPGDPVTLTATVSSTAAGTPTGTVDFLDGTAVLGTAPVDSSGRATLVVTSLELGTRTITARYSGDGTFIPSSGTATVTVKAATNLSLSTSANPSWWGQPVTLSAVLATAAGSPVAGASVQFYDGTTYLGSGTTSATGQASLSSSQLEVGTHTLRATFSGSSTHDAAASATVGQVVNKVGTVTTLTSSANPVGRGKPVTFTATVSPAVTGSGTITGSVTFKNGATVLGTVAVQNGRASLTATLNPGTYPITATYGGDTRFGSSTSTVLSQVVSKGKK